MSKLTDVFYLAGNSDRTCYNENELKLERIKATELHEKLCNILSVEQRTLFEELSKVECHIQSIQEGIVATKGVALGIQIASEAFLINTSGDDYEMFSKYL